MLVTWRQRQFCLDAITFLIVSLLDLFLLHPDLLLFLLFLLLLHHLLLIGLQMLHHGLQSILLLIQLLLQLRHDLRLNACLRRRTVAQHVFTGNVLHKLRHVRARRVASGPPTNAVAE